MANPLLSLENLAKLRCSGGERVPLPKLERSFSLLQTCLELAELS